MRMPISSAITSLAFATAFGTASATHLAMSDRKLNDNRATQDQLQRDASERSVNRSPLGVVISPAAPALSGSGGRALQGTTTRGTSSELGPRPRSRIFGKLFSGRRQTVSVE